MNLPPTVYCTDTVAVCGSDEVFLRNKVGVKNDSGENAEESAGRANGRPVPVKE